MGGGGGGGGGSSRGGHGDLSPGDQRAAESAVTGSTGPGGGGNVGGPAGETRGSQTKTKTKSKSSRSRAGGRSKGRGRGTQMAPAPTPSAPVDLGLMPALRPEPPIPQEAPLLDPDSLANVGLTDPNVPGLPPGLSVPDPPIPGSRDIMELGTQPGTTLDATGTGETFGGDVDELGGGGDIVGGPADIEEPTKRPGEPEEPPDIEEPDEPDFNTLLRGLGNPDLLRKTLLGRKVRSRLW